VSSGYSTLPALYPQLPFALNELTPVAVAASVPYVFVVPPDAPYRTMKDFVDHAKSRPKQLNFASGGNATGGHLLGVWFKSETKLTSSTSRTRARRRRCRRCWAASCH
jgi:tripartite-type tricarboxylate transporter receptor subunit TctC